jgi:predicted nucleic acid-binding protein
MPSSSTPLSTICVDASVVVPLVTDPPTGPFQALWNGWRAGGQPVIAPRLLLFEVVNVFYRMSVKKTVTEQAALASVRAAPALPIGYHGDDALHLAALDLARRFKLPATYDAHYLALAEQTNAEFWTADQRLFNTVSSARPWVKSVQGQATP